MKGNIAKLEKIVQGISEAPFKPIIRGWEKLSPRQKGCVEVAAGVGGLGLASLLTYLSGPATARDVAEAFRTAKAWTDYIGPSVTSLLLVGAGTGFVAQSIYSLIDGYHRTRYGRGFTELKRGVK